MEKTGSLGYSILYQQIERWKALVCVASSLNIHVPQNFIEDQNRADDLLKLAERRKRSLKLLDKAASRYRKAGNGLEQTIKLVEYLNDATHRLYSTPLRGDLLDRQRAVRRHLEELRSMAKCGQTTKTAVEEKKAEIENGLADLAGAYQSPVGNVTEQSFGFCTEESAFA